MQTDFAALIAVVRELFLMFPPGQQAKVDQLRGDLEALTVKYAAGVAAYVEPDPIPPAA